VTTTSENSPSTHHNATHTIEPELTPLPQQVLHQHPQRETNHPGARGGRTTRANGGSPVGLHARLASPGGGGGYPRRVFTVAIGR
jgi:hypothetical protein